MLLIAIDACPPALIDQGCREGWLPNLSRLRAEGRRGLVESNARLFPGAVWPDFFTPGDVSRHGIYHALQWDPATTTFRTPGPEWIDAPAFWDALASSGAAVITLDIPFASSRSRPERVTEVLGWGTHENLWTLSRPAGLLKDLNRRHGRSSLVREAAGPRSERALTADLEALVRDVGRRASVIEDLATRFEWDLLIACFAETHHAGHWFWGSRATGEPQGGLKRVLRAVDAVVPRLRALLRPDDHLGLFSLHGMTARCHADRFAEALRDYLGPPTGTRGPVSNPLGALRSLAPDPIRRAIIRGLPRDVYSRLVERAENDARDWSRAQAVINPLDHLFYLSVADSDSRERRIEALAAEFSSLRASDGRPAVESAARPRDLYSGPRLDMLPDLVVCLAPELGESLTTASGRMLTGARRSWQDGEHVPEGFYLQAGPGIAPDSLGPNVRVERLAAWLCSPAGLTVPGP